MRWSDEKPVSPGYYWHRCNAHDMPRVVEIASTLFDGLAEVNAFGWSSPLRDGDWAGPISPPGDTVRIIGSMIANTSANGQWTVTDAVRLCESVREHLSYFLGRPFDDRLFCACRAEAEEFVSGMRVRSEIPPGAGVSIDFSHGQIRIVPTWDDQPVAEAISPAST